MKAFTLRLQDATHAEEITGVTSFVGEDASGSFGILAGTPVEARAWPQEGVVQSMTFMMPGEFLNSSAFHFTF